MPFRWLTRLFVRAASPAPLPREAVVASPAPSRVTLIAPLVEGQSWCDEARRNADFQDDDDVTAFCAALGRNGAPGIAATLDKLGPAISPSGRFELGYTLVMPLLRFFVREQGGWRIDPRAIDVALSTIADIERPVVLHLSATHFSFEGKALAKELGSDPDNLMWTKHGPLASSEYFTTAVFAWTLMDEAPINTYRRVAFEAVLNQIARLADPVRARIRAVSFLGETHQLFHDLEDAGAGYGSAFDITDYSPASRQGFRQWLQRRFDTLGALNEALSSNYAAFEDIEPPSQDLKDRSEPDRLQHLDEHAAGNLPVIGWSVRPGGAPLQIDIYLDGALAASTTSDLNRLDVLEARPDFLTPNVGFRHDIDYSSLSPGRHTVAVFARSGEGRPYRLGERTIIVGCAGAHTASIPAGELPYARNTDTHVIGVIDRPASELKLLYNPLARLWMEYREYQVLRFQERFAKLAFDSGLDVKKLFSHQMLTALYPDYNPEKISVDLSLKSNPHYNAGVSMYGGSAFGDHFFRVKDTLGWECYGLGEFNPLVALPPSAYVEMFDRHNCAGAVFIAPYYLSNRIQAGENEITKMLVSPDNPHRGSRELYEAISQLMREG